MNITDKEFIDIYHKSSSIANILRSLDMLLSTTNYKIIYKIINNK